MKMLALALAVLAGGCAATDASNVAMNPKLTKADSETAEISRREQRCVDMAVNRSNEKIAATPDSRGAERTHQAGAERDRELSKCTTTADREKEELSTRERSEYQGAAEQEHDRTRLMSILTTSLPR